jgi:hypothetical protein
VLHMRGIVRLSSSDVTGAREDFEEALALLAAVGDPSWHLNLENSLGQLELGAGDVDGAHERLESALQTAAIIGNRVVPAGILSALAMIDLVRGEPDDARRRFAEAFTAGRAIGDVFAAVGSLLGLALSCSATGRLLDAATVHGATDAWADRTQHQLSESYAAFRDSDRANLRRALGGDAYGAAYQRGRKLDVGAVTDLVRDLGAESVSPS